MKLLSIVGKEEKIDFIIANYLMGSGLQPENAQKVFEKSWNLTYFTYQSEIKEMMKNTQNLMKSVGIAYQEKEVKLTYSFEELTKRFEEIEKQFQEVQRQIGEKTQEIQKIESKIEPIEFLKSIQVNLEELYHLEYMRFRFGKMTIQNFKKMKQEIDTMNCIVMELGQKDEEVWLIYFTPHNFSAKIDSFFNVMKFERIWLPEEVKGKAGNFVTQIEEYKQNAQNMIQNLTGKMQSYKAKYERELENIYNQLNLLERLNGIKKYMAHDKKGSFYIVGWVPYTKLQNILPELEKEEDIECVVKSHDEVANIPPTKLKNSILVRPFEAIVKMYGLPNYTEMDPTTFVAITAFLMFGFMFGDVGQGAVIAVIGLVLAKKKMSLGPVMTIGGISAILFGFLYGSVFGKEDIIKGIIPSPMDNITTMLIAGIGVGAILIIVAMLLNIRNGIKNKEPERIFFDKNGLAGLIFYGTILVLVVVFLLKGKLLFSLGLVLILLGIPLLLILFQEKLTILLHKRKEQKPKSSFVEKIFELIEMLLSFASNTISFIRLAAFAINHVGLCMAVYILSNMVAGAGSIAIAIIGNGIVIVLEGLIVAIQVLRLEYYELFSRFYSGDGKEYKPMEEMN